MRSQCKSRRCFSAVAKDLGLQQLSFLPPNLTFHRFHSSYWPGLQMAQEFRVH